VASGLRFGARDDGSSTAVGRGVGGRVSADGDLVTVSTKWSMPQAGSEADTGIAIGVGVLESDIGRL
jgi:hypothetical protein